jgi:hypothetical protein
MEKSMTGRKVWLSEFYGDDNERTARLYMIEGEPTYEVEFFENKQVVGQRSLTHQSVHYAEDLCENWVEGIIK